jgi:hypothetical protein
MSANQIRVEEDALGDGACVEVRLNTTCLDVAAVGKHRTLTKEFKDH